MYLLPSQSPLLHRASIAITDGPSGKTTYSVITAYFPSSSVGSPPISPSYHSSWSSTSLAVRVPGRLNRKYGSDYEDIVYSGTTSSLARQFVIPLTGLAAFGPFPVAISDLIGNSLVCFGKATSGAAKIVRRIVDASGNDLWLTTRTFTVTLVADTYLVTAAGQFAQTDVGSDIVFGNVTVGFSTNYVLAVPDVDHALLLYAYPTGAPTLGAIDATIGKKGAVLISDINNFPNTSNPTAFNPFIGPVAPPATNGLSLSAIFSPTYYLVIEVGFEALGGSVTRTLRFGDPSDTLAALGDTAGSSGSPFLYYRQASLIL